MKKAAGRLLCALVLIAAGAVCWSEAGLARRVAGAHERLATLHYDVNDGIDETKGTADRLTLPVGSLGDEIRQHRSRVAYWRIGNEAGAPPEGSADDAATRPELPDADGGNQTDEGEAVEAELRFVSTNTAFRTATRDPSSRSSTVARLDMVLQSYADVLRADPHHADAAYNYEYVVRFRDTVARGRAPARGRGGANEEFGGSVDLPPGPTIHGRPGAPPPEIPGDQFRTITPVPYEEREEIDPGLGPRPSRKG